MFFNSRFSITAAFPLLLAANLVGSATVACAADTTDPTAHSTGERIAPPVRSTPEMQLNLGQINVHEGGAVCYQNPESITLWRENSQLPERLELKDTSTNQQLSLVWPAGQASLIWPVDKLAVNNGTNYLLKTGGIAEIVVLLQIPEDLQNVTARNTWLQEQGCHVVLQKP